MKTPKFCPNPECKNHFEDEKPSGDTWWRTSGSYSTKSAGNVRRFICRDCGKWFSERTLSIDYYTKKKVKYDEIFNRLISGESVSAISRNTNLSIESVSNRIGRVARNVILLQEELLGFINLAENLAADGFESFDVSHYFPNNINVLVGEISQFVYSLTHSSIRRKGSMTGYQKKRRSELDLIWTPRKGSFSKSFSNMLLESIGSGTGRSSRSSLSRLMKIRTTRVRSKRPNLSGTHWPMVFCVIGRYRLWLEERLRILFSLSTILTEKFGRTSRLFRSRIRAFLKMSRRCSNDLLSIFGGTTS